MAKPEKNPITRVSDGYWEHFYAPVPPPYRITGKYLVFSTDRELLAIIALDELSNGGFHHAKTHLPEIKPPSGEYVLCLYYSDDSRKGELKQKYGNRPNVKYRFWKSHQATMANKYSPEFLSKLEPADRRAFLENKPPEE